MGEAPGRKLVVFAAAIGDWVVGRAEVVGRC